MAPDLNDLHYFAQVVDHGGFAPAGRALGIPKSKLSRRVAALEERLGVRLVQRSTRRFSVTEVGATYYRHCKAMLVEAEAAQEAIDLIRVEPRGVVRLTCPTALLHARVGEMLAAFMVAHPRVELHLEATNRRVDVVAEGIDVAIRARTPPLEDSGLMLRVLAERSWSIVASPALLARHAPIQGPSDLAALPSLALNAPRPDHEWLLQGLDGATVRVPHRPRLLTDDMTALRMAAVAGVGVVDLPLMMLGPELASGQLVLAVPPWTTRSGVVHAVFASRRGMLPAVRALIDFLADRFAEIQEI